MGRITVRRPALRLDLHRTDGQDGTAPRADRRVETLAVEEPMELRVDGVAMSTTMRTPGDDFDLALGFLHAEGVIGAAGDVVSLVHCRDADASGSPTYNVVDATLAAGRSLDPERRRATVTSSACGVCGTASIEAIQATSGYDVLSDPVSVGPETLVALPARLRSAQRGFDRTGGLHAAGLFTSDGQLLVAREDVGRHNAVDKVVGWALREGRVPLSGQVLVVTSRASFELTQKAWAAGIPVLVAVSAPSSLAVDLAERAGITLVGFVREQRLTVYAGAHRLGRVPTAVGQV